MTGPDPRATWTTGRLLSTAARLVEQSWNANLRDDGVSHAGLVVLHLLARGPATQRQLADSQHLTEQTVGRTIAHLESTGHLCRTPDPGDRRRRVVELTDSGRELLTEMSGRGARLTDTMLGGAGIDLVQFRSALDLLIATFDAPAADGTDHPRPDPGSPQPGQRDGSGAG